MPVPPPSPNRKQPAHAPSLEGPLRAFPDDRLPRATDSLEPLSETKYLTPSNSISSS